MSLIWSNEQKQHKQALASACYNLALLMLFNYHQEEFFHIFLNVTHKERHFSLQLGSWRVCWKYLFLAHPAHQPQDPSMWPDQMLMFSLVFHPHASMPSLRSTPSWLPTAPHNAPLWLLSAAGNSQMAWALGGAQ